MTVCKYKGRKARRLTRVAKAVGFSIFRRWLIIGTKTQDVLLLNHFYTLLIIQISLLLRVSTNSETQVTHLDSPKQVDFKVLFKAWNSHLTKLPLMKLYDEPIPLCQEGHPAKSIMRIAVLRRPRMVSSWRGPYNYEMKVLYVFRTPWFMFRYSSKNDVCVAVNDNTRRALHDSFTVLKRRLGRLRRNILSPFFTSRYSFPRLQWNSCDCFGQNTTEVVLQKLPFQPWLDNSVRRSWLYGMESDNLFHFTPFSVTVLHFPLWQYCKCNRCEFGGERDGGARQLYSVLGLWWSLQIWTDQWKRPFQTSVAPNIETGICYVRVFDLVIT